jgi:hypothetical protein
VGDLQVQQRSNGSSGVQRDQEELRLPPKKMPTPLTDLKAEDVEIMLDKYGRGSGAYSPLEFQLKNYFKYKNPNISDVDEAVWLSQLDPKEAINLLFVASKDQGFESRVVLTEVLEDIQSVINSPVFKKGLLKLESVTAKTSIGELLTLYQLGEDEFERKLNVLSSEGFKKFSSEVKDKLGLDVSKDILVLEKAYEDHLEGKSILDPLIVSALSSFRETFPDVRVDLVSDISRLSFQVHRIAESEEERFDLVRYKQELSKDKVLYDKLKKDYDLSLESYTRVTDLEDLLAKGLEILDSPKAKEVYDYLNKNYPDLELGDKVSYVFLSWRDGFAKGYVDPIVNGLKSDPESVDKFLNIYGKNLSNMALSNVDYLFRDLKTPISELAQDKEFSKFINDQLERYPSLKNSLNIENVARLAVAYEEKENYLKIQEDLSKYGKFDFPVFDLIRGTLAIEAMNLADRLGMSNLKINTLVGDNWGSELEGADVLSLLETEDAKTLYQNLTKDWGFGAIDIAQFVISIESKEDLKFFENSENLEKVQKLDELYSLGIFAGDLLELWKITNLEEKVLLNYNQLAKPEVVEFILSHSPEDFQSPTDSNFEGNLSSLKSYGYFDIIKDFEKYSKLAATLETEYGLGKEDSVRFLEITTQEELESGELKEAFKWAKEVYYKNGEVLHGDGKSVDNLDFLLLAREVYKEKDYEETFLHFERLGFERGKYDTSYVLKFIHADLELRGIVCEEKFLNLVEKLDTKFFHGERDLKRVLEYAELHRELKLNPRRLEALLSDTFQDVTNTVGQMFHVATERPSTLLPMTRVAEGFDKSSLEGLVGLLKLKGEKISSNDVVILSEVSKNPELRDLLEDRETMLVELTKIYEKQSFPRENIDQLQDYPEDSKEEQTEYSIQRAKERKAILDSYTERPPLDELSNLQLLRLTMITRALATEEWKSKLGEIVASDIEDKSTEKGGTIRLEGDKISLVETVSMSESNGSFYDQKYNHLVDGIGTFHLHALESDESKYSGPSGWLGAGGGDVGYVDFYNQVDTVFTAMGHPKDSNGNPIQDQLRMNVDTYFVDKRDSNNHKLRIIDLGEVVVPFNPK